MGINGNQIAIGSDAAPYYIARPATLTVSYCDIQGGRRGSGIYIEPGRILNWLEGNINADPLFVESHYSLSQIAAGQSADSPCVDAGSNTAAALGLDEYSTRSDSVADTGQVDIGLHYFGGEGQYQLVVNTVGENGTVSPRFGTFDKFTVVKLTATLDPGYRVKWIGTDNDSSTELTNTVTMDSNKTVTVEFVEYVGRTVTVPNDYRTIQEAIYNVREGDTIVVDPGTYYGGYEGIILRIDKDIIITSRNPDDPNSVATTIIDGYRGTNDWTNAGIRFASNVTSKTVINGITIQNCGGFAGIAPDGNRQLGTPDGEDGGCLEGAAIFVYNGASPIIKNCIIRNNYMGGGDGGDGADAQSGDGDNAGNAGRGGWGGWAHGGAVYCAPGSRPQFINCTIEDNVARGGIGGDGGDWDPQGGTANYGGSWSVERAEYYHSIGFEIEFIEGPLWERFEWDDAAAYGPIFNDPNLTSYFGDYRWYSGYGGGAYCDIGSEVSFVNCQIRRNRSEGGFSGTGGMDGGRPLEPILAYEIPSFGGGVYCAADSAVTFTGCTFEDNLASPVQAGVDPNHRLDPYMGYGGGVCAEDSAAVTFIDCDFSDNQSDSGGGIYTDNTTVTIVDCSVESNTALRGGGFVGANGLINVIGSEFTNNSAIADVNDPNEDVLAAGGGLYCWMGGLNIQDCTISGNIADFSGGGVYLRDVNTASLNNSLVLNNRAGRDGGGVSANFYTNSILTNCTLADNSATGDLGEPGNNGLGGGLYCSYESDCEIVDSIFWENSALEGRTLAVATGFEFDKRPATATVSYSNIDQTAVWVDEGCTFNWGEGNIDEDPLFTSGPNGNHYLSQIDAGQSQESPCVDAGSDYASNVGMVGYTTRTDEGADTSIVDMGYHYLRAEPCIKCDIVRDGIINFHDFAVIADRWFADDCSQANDWCQCADLTTDTYVDLRDMAFVADCWLVSDDVAPLPNPSAWSEEPDFSSQTSVRMIAEAAIDAWGWDVEYYFECFFGDCHDSGWRQDPNYTDGGLAADGEYGYRVRTRDGAGNETDWSEIVYVTREDREAPAPPPTWLTEPTALSETSVLMEVNPSSDESGVEYYFENIDVNDHDSDWQDGTSYTDTGLDPNTEYSYRVRARDKSPNQNETIWSETITVVTTSDVVIDLTAPAPDPMAWDMEDDPNGNDGRPREVRIDANGNGLYDFDEYFIIMRCVEATDDSGFVEYFFQCTSASGFSSGWMTFPTGENPTYLVRVGRSGQFPRFRVKARDASGNETGWSAELTAPRLGGG
jgi:hypothetical protein